MGGIDSVVIQPVLWVVYIILPLFSGSLSSYSSFPAIGDLPLDWYSILLSIDCVGLGLLFGRYDFQVAKAVYNDIPVNNLGYTLVLFFLIMVCSILPPCLLIRGLYLSMPYVLVSLRCSIWLLRLLLWIVIRLLTHSMIFAFKNRRSCQVLLLVASVLMGILGSPSANLFQAIPIVVGFILGIPDFDLEPGGKFKLRFTRFVTRNMDKTSIEKLLDSKHCKMLCCNEMMPSLADLESPVFSCFVKREDRQYCDSTVNPRYEIGLGSVLTSSNEHHIDVVVSTPRCGMKKMTMRNTTLSRYNLHKSAGFWRDNPRLGILNHGEVKTHCISTEEWIKCCGLEEYRFVTSDDYDRDV